MIEASNLTKKYGELTAVENLSFKADEGEILGFLGPNGAGKTTTMRILTCYMPPTSGTAKVAGFDIIKQSIEVRKRIGYMPEHPPLYPDMKVSEYIEFTGLLRGLSKKEVKTKLDEVAEKTGVMPVIDRLIKHLSKGFRQRVGLAQALIHDPPVLILDEPTIGLDPIQIAEIRGLIKSMSGNRTVVLSTHILPEVTMVCNKVLIIHKGKIIALDTPENLSQTLGAQPATRVRVMGDEEIGSELEAIAGVTKVERTARGTYMLESEKDVTAEIASLAKQNGWEVAELSTQMPSLEEIFIRLTSE